MARDWDRAAWWQRAVASVAALSAVLATVLLIGASDSVLVDLVAVTLTVVTAAPLFAPGRATLEAACRFCAVLLVVLAIPLGIFGALFYLPGAALLLLARYTGRARSPD